MRISDWSSDVCSSDLSGAAASGAHPSTAPRIGSARQQHARLTVNLGQYYGRDHRLAACADDERPKLADSLGMVRTPGFDGLFRRPRLTARGRAAARYRALRTLYVSVSSCPFTPK